MIVAVDFTSQRAMATASLLRDEQVEHRHDAPARRTCTCSIGRPASPARFRDPQEYDVMDSDGCEIHDVPDAA